MSNGLTTLLLSILCCFHQLHSNKWWLSNLLLAEKTTLKDLLLVKILKHAREIQISLGSEARAFSPFRGKTVKSPFTKTSMQTRMPVQTDQALSSIHSLNLNSDDSQKAKCKETCDTDQNLPGYCHIIAEKLLEHQVRGWVPLYSAFLYFKQIIWLELFMSSCFVLLMLLF